MGVGGFDSPELRGPVAREGALWLMSRIVTAGLALARSGDEENAVRALVVEYCMGEDLARRFFGRFREPWILAMAEASREAGTTPEEMAAAFSEAFERRIEGGAA